MLASLLGHMAQVLALVVQLLNEETSLQKKLRWFQVGLRFCESHKHCCVLSDRPYKYIAGKLVIGLLVLPSKFMNTRVFGCSCSDFDVTFVNVHDSKPSCAAVCRWPRHICILYVYIRHYVIHMCLWHCYLWVPNLANFIVEAIIWGFLCLHWSLKVLTVVLSLKR